jgi:hypothetical protein
MAGKGSSRMDFIQSLKTNAPPPSGVYVGAVIGEPRPINDERRRGARFTIEITEGSMRGRRVPIELTTNSVIFGRSKGGSSRWASTLRRGRLNSSPSCATLRSASGSNSNSNAIPGKAGSTSISSA